MLLLTLRETYALNRSPFSKT